jgi:hypothetical protein
MWWKLLTMEKLNLFIALLGGRQEDDKLEAHNFFAGVGKDMTSLLPQIKSSWNGVTHIDAYCMLEQIDGYKIVIHESKKEKVSQKDTYPRLMVYNIGYYKPGQFAEFHKLIPMVLKDKDDQWRERLKSDPDFAEGQELDQTARSHVDNTLPVSGVLFDADDEIQIQEEIAGYTIELVPIDGEIKNPPLKVDLGYLFVKELKAI